MKTLTVQYKTTINEFITIPAGSKVTLVDEWNKYDCFVAIEYKGKQYYIHAHYLTNSNVTVSA